MVDSERILLLRSREVVGVGAPFVIILSWEMGEELLVEYFIFYDNSEEEVIHQRLASQQVGIEGFAEINLQSLIDYARSLVEARLLKMRLDRGEQASKWSAFPRLEEISKANLLYLFVSGACREKLLRIAEMSSYRPFRELICDMKKLPKLCING